MFITHPLIKSNSIEERLYQSVILGTAVGKNTLCVLPTGTGKTALAVLLSAQRLEKFGGKILVLAPTRPLAEQHCSAFQSMLNIDKEKIVVLTGVVNPIERETVYKEAKIITATPQTVANDLRGGRLSLANFSLLVVDECILGDSMIRLYNGKYVAIKDLVNIVNSGKNMYVESFNHETNRFEAKRAVRGFKIPNKNALLKITLKDGKSVVVTPDHPFLTYFGDNVRWTSASKLSVKSEIAVELYNHDYGSKTSSIVDKKSIVESYNLRQRKFMEVYKKSILLRKRCKNVADIAAKLNVNENTVRNYIYSPQKPIPQHTIERLEMLGLLPLTYDNIKLRVICRILGHIYGDGWLLMKNGEPHLLGFSGKIEDLKAVQKDLKFLGVKHSSIYSKITESKIKTSAGMVITIRGRTNSFSCTDSALVRLLYALGVPHGKKTETKVFIPKWLLNSSTGLKSEFLSALMGAEGYVPQNVKNSRIFCVSRFAFFKTLQLKSNGVKYAKQLIKLFKDCGVKTRLKFEKGNIRKSGTKTIKFLITIDNSMDNMLSFFLKIGFKYARRKEEKSNLILKYLLYKESFKKRYKDLYNTCRILYKQNKNMSYISTATGVSNNVLRSWIYRRAPSYISPFFPKFSEWLKGESKKEIYPLRWIKIKSIQNINTKDFVYDIEVEDTHNFIANGIVVHNCHRSVKKYAYPTIVSTYLKQAKNPRVLGLTASPGSTKEKIEEVCRSLGAEAVELRTEEDEDVKPYIQETQFEVLRAELPEKMLKIQSSLKAALRERMDKLKQFRVNVYSKSDLLLAQKRAASGLRAGNPANFRIISLTAETLKIWHALELLETQSISALCLYMEKLRVQGNKAAERALQDLKVQNALRTAQELKAEGFESPKFGLLEKLVKENSKASIIVFSHFRDNIASVYSALKKIEGCKPAVLVGQAGETGQSQREQIDTIKDFTAGVYNVLVTSPVGEEGLNIPAADIAVFYEPVSSEIRTIQRRGRVGRVKAGRVFVLVNKGTRDEGNLYTAKRKERKMHEALEEVGRGLLV